MFWWIAAAVTGFIVIIAEEAAEGQRAAQRSTVKRTGNSIRRKAEQARKHTQRQFDRRTRALDEVLDSPGLDAEAARTVRQVRETWSRS